LGDWIELLRKSVIWVIASLRKT